MRVEVVEVEQELVGVDCLDAERSHKRSILSAEADAW
jgi:hypothetical protein